MSEAFMLPGFYEENTYPTTQLAESSILSVPEDIIIMILSYLSQRDRLHFGQTSSKSLSKTLVSLYRNVSLSFKDGYQPVATLRMLARTPSLASHVRKLMVMVPQSNDNEKRKFGMTASQEVASAVINMDCLQHFEWISEEIPPLDALWGVLRLSCPQLCRLTVSVGLELPRRDSQLHQFSNLTLFKLQLTPSFFERYFGEGRYVPENMPALAELWDMLIHRCPDLESLTIDGHSYHATSMPHLCEGRWPKLRSLSLPHIIVNWEEATGTEDPSMNPTQRPFIRFLEAHTSLRRLDLPGMVQSTISFEPLSEAALPLLESFSGHVSHIAQLPNRNAIRTIRIPAVTFESHINEYDAMPALQSMPNLTSLELHILLHPDLACDVSFVRDLCNACPSLESFDFSCARAAGLNFESLGEIMSDMTHLRRLTYRSLQMNGETLHVSAHTLFSTLTSLTWLKLRFDRYGGMPGPWIHTTLVEEGIFTTNRTNESDVLRVQQEKYRAGRTPRRRMAPIQRTIGHFTGWDLMNLPLDWTNPMFIRSLRQTVLVFLITFIAIVAGVLFGLVEARTRRLKVSPTLEL